MVRRATHSDLRRDTAALTPEMACHDRIKLKRSTTLDSIMISGDFLGAVERSNRGAGQHH